MTAYLQRHVYSARLLRKARSRNFSLNACHAGPGSVDDDTVSESNFPLRMWNTLSGRKEPIPSPSGRPLSWYMCGPTVYDHAHLGHARTYVSFDIIRRVLADFFRVEVFQVMGLTDIDDKIIARARSEKVDFLTLARRFEEDFMQDMASLGVREPCTTTRVSEHVDDIVSFISTIVANGLAYPAPSSSVYIDSRRYQAKYLYGHFRTPQLSSEADLEAEQEPSVSPGEKRHPHDFALWKGSKPGEPNWPSPWGPGRPGWHIECSAMISSMFGPSLDVHSGGVDLMFPHHENEIAQCHAHFLPPASQLWCPTFWHTGHLYISGLKMSKSLKNFITIKDMLADYSAAAFRVFCLAHRYSSNVDYSTDRLQDAVNILKRFQDFLGSTSSSAPSTSSVVAPSSRRWSSHDHQMYSRIVDSRAAVRSRLGDDMDTPGALKALLDLVAATNLYIAGQSPTARATLSSPPRPEIVTSARDLVVSTMAIFGVDVLPQSHEASRDLSQVLGVLASFRGEVRQLARARPPDLPQRLLAECDKLRDHSLPELGIALEDTPQGSRCRVLTPEQLAAQRSQGSKPTSSASASSSSTTQPQPSKAV